MFNFGIFAKSPKPDELVRKWRSSVRTQERELDRQLRNITTEEAKVKRTIQQLAKKGDISSCRSLAKELVRSQKQKDRIITSKAQLNSILMELTRQVALIKVAGSLQKSTQVMKTVNQLMRIPQLQHTMMEMSKEMIRAGVIEEMTEEMFDDLEDDELEEEAEAEVENVLAQITDGVLGKAKNVAAPARPVGVSQKQQPQQQQQQLSENAADVSETESELDLDDMRARLSALRS
ncbi:Vacuolar protein-sorting-associated protein 24 [Coemansia interrupta]|uniref:Vacuolar protein-sorting-associated protein 24 n=1 Tax=Coemansia interrupta TaxID=1126814 RepID=A0A9W8HBY8_9FUNG|nr:Vacuolar protein-sorting-associated protein 24 [Coemansia interrupta]